MACIAFPNTNRKETKHHSVHFKLQQVIPHLLHDNLRENIPHLPHVSTKIDTMMANVTLSRGSDTLVPSRAAQGGTPQVWHLPAPAAPETPCFPPKVSPQPHRPPF